MGKEYAADGCGEGARRRWWASWCVFRREAVPRRPAGEETAADWTTSLARLGRWRRPPGGSRWRAAAGWWTGGCSAELCRRHREMWREVDVRWMAGADGWNEENKEKPEYERWEEANRKLQNLTQQPLEAKHISSAI